MTVGFFKEDVRSSVEEFAGRRRGWNGSDCNNHEVYLSSDSKQTVKEKVRDPTALTTRYHTFNTKDQAHLRSDVVAAKALMRIRLYLPVESPGPFSEERSTPGANAERAARQFRIISGLSQLPWSQHLASVPTNVL